MNRSLARTSSNSDVEDIDFFLNEILRHMRMDRKELFSLPPLELLSMVPHPSGTGTLVCGYAAVMRLADLVDRELARQRESGKLDPSSVLGELKRILIRRFFAEDAELNTREVSKILSASMKIIRKEKRNRVFYIPCYLGSESIETSIILGPVEFVSHTIAGERLEVYIAAERERASTEADGDPEFTNKLLSNFATQAQDCLHVAIVSIDNCDFKSAERMAESTVQSAIDALVLMIGPVHSNYFEMRRHGSGPLKDTTLAVSEDRIDHLGTRIGWRHNSLGKGWWDALMSEGGDELLANIGAAILHSSASHTPSPLAQVFVDSMHWYAEGVREEQPAAKIIKFVTALERLVITKKRDSNLTETFTSRVMSLLYVFGEGNQKALRSEVDALYEMRSRLVHGSYSPTRSSLGIFVRQGESISRHAIQRLLFHVSRDSLTSGISHRQRAEDFFSKLVKLVAQDGAGLRPGRTRQRTPCWHPRQPRLRRYLDRRSGVLRPHHPRRREK